MSELLDIWREAEGLKRRPSATVALHRRVGMLLEANAAGFRTTAGTTSPVAPPPYWGWMASVDVEGVAVFGSRVEDVTVFGGRVEDVPVRVADAPDGTYILVNPADEFDDTFGVDDGDEVNMFLTAERVIAERGAAVEVARPQVPELTDQPVENIRRLFNLTMAELTRLFGITERHGYRWVSGTVPEDRRRMVDALQAVGRTIIGGLGPEGAKAWLYAGEPSAAELVAAGRVDDLIARAEEVIDSPFT